MPVVLTVGTNSWCTLAEANAYFDAKYGAAVWATLSNDEKKRLLITARNWIVQQNMFSITLTDSSELVRNAQCETAWFIYNWFDDYDKHRALSESGVKSYRMLDTSETLDKVGFPSFLMAILAPYNIENENAMPRVHRDLSDNAVK